MKKLSIVLALYAMVISYPAYLQTARTVNAYLDQWATVRVSGMLPEAVQLSLLEE